MTEVTTDTSNRNERSLAVGGIWYRYINYTAAQSVVSKFLTE